MKGTRRPRGGRPRVRVACNAACEARLPASGNDRLLLLVEALNNEEEDCRTAQGGAARQIRRTGARQFPNRTETRGSNHQRTAQRNLVFHNVSGAEPK